ncbi:hypothetical protein HW555_009696 [Spodoptera exigua]|uniref:Uncharacterized protein n=1 Tax=Spodoptera exigua TaxID=7107 RepID=A0A835GA57_SPOEX|nr:hypothetical protein HW555_009696 [Spodoptera exigua]
MYLQLALCLLCACIAPLTCRSVDTHEPPSEDLEPFVARHHHDGNIAELLIPLLERSLAQSEARKIEHRRTPGKKVIQVLPYRGSEEHKRKGWRKLNSHKKQVVEITPLHGKDRAKPLAYILSAAKPSQDEHANANDVSSSNSDEEHEKSTSEEQRSTEEVKDVNERRSDVSESRGTSSNAQSSEDDKAIDNASDRSSDVTAEDSRKSAEKTKDDRKFVLIEDSNERLKAKLSKKHRKSHRRSNKDVTEEKNSEGDVTLEIKEAATIESGESAEQFINEDRAETSEVLYDSSKRYVTLENSDVTHEVTREDVTVVDEDVTSETRPVDVTAEDKNATAEDETVTQEDKDVTAENITTEVKSDTTEYKETSEVTSQKHDIINVEESVSSELRIAPNDLVTSENVATVEDNENGETNEDISTEIAKEAKLHTRKLTKNYKTDLNDPVSSSDVTDETEAALENRFLDNNIVISGNNRENDSVEKNFGKLFNDRAEDIIQLIQSSVEASTIGHKDCVEKPEKHHDHKFYRLSFLFNK